MTYAEALTYRAALEAAMLSGAGAVSFMAGDKRVTYANREDAAGALSQINRDIHAYERRGSNINPAFSRPRWQ